MEFHLPIADLTVSVFLILGIGGAVGFLSGLFGVGGGFLMTPLLMFIGVPPVVAVGTGANQIVASSITGTLTHWRRGTVDIKMGLVLLAGGMAGSVVGTALFTLLKALGTVELMISLFYVVFLGGIGTLMFVEGMRAVLVRERGGGRRPSLRRRAWIHRLPLRTRFRRSKLYISALLPLGVGFLVGILAAIMGVGGGFIMVPAMIYLIGMPTAVVVGTSLFQILFVAATVTLLQAWNNQTVDFPLAMLLVLGSVVGTHWGARLGARLPAEELRALLALVVLAVAIKLGTDLLIRPDDLYSLSGGLVP